MTSLPDAPPGSRVRVHAVVVAAALGGNQVASYLLVVIAARVLAPATFGELSSLLAVLVVGAVPAMGLQTATALRVARLVAGGSSRTLDRRDAAPLLSLGLTTAGAVLVVALLAVPALVALLHLTSPVAALCLAAALGPITLHGLFLGILQGSQRFGVLARLLVVEGVCRIGATVLGLLVFRTPTGALAGTAIGASVLIVVGWLICGRPLPAGRVWRQLGEVLHTGAAMLALVGLVNLDLVLARHTLPAHQAGEYAVGAVVAKIAYWFPQAVAVLALPRLADPAARRRVVPLALAVCGGLNVVVLLGALLFAPTGVALIGGAGYTDSGLALWPFALVGSLLSQVQILLYSRIASSDRRSTWLIWLAVVLEIVLVTGWLHGGIGEVVTGAVIAVGLLVCGGALIEYRARPKV